MSQRSDYIFCVMCFTFSVRANKKKKNNNAFFSINILSTHILYLHQIFCLSKNLHPSKSVCEPEQNPKGSAMFLVNTTLILGLPGSSEEMKKKKNGKIPFSRLMNKKIKILALTNFCTTKWSFVCKKI